MIENRFLKVKKTYTTKEGEKTAWLDVGRLTIFTNDDGSIGNIKVEISVLDKEIVAFPKRDKGEWEGRAKAEKAVKVDLDESIPF